MTVLGVALLLAWAVWQSRRPAGAPVIALHGPNSCGIITLRDRDGRIVASPSVPPGCGQPHQAAFSAAEGKLYVCGDNGVHEWVQGKWVQLAPWTSRPGTDTTVWSFSLSQSAAMVYGVGGYSPDGPTQWYLRRPGPLEGEMPLLLDSRTTPEGWLPGDAELAGRVGFTLVALRIAPDGAVMRVAGLPIEVDSTGTRVPEGDILAVVADGGSDALVRWSGRAHERPVALMERQGIRLQLGPVSPDGRLVACVGRPSDLSGLHPLWRSPGPNWLHVVDVTTGRLIALQEEPGPIGTVVWPLERTLFYEGFGHLRPRDTQRRFGPVHDIVRLDLEPLRAGVVFRTTQNLVATDGLPTPRLAVAKTEAGEAAPCGDRAQHKRTLPAKEGPGNLVTHEQTP